MARLCQRSRRHRLYRVVGCKQDKDPVKPPTLQTKNTGKSIHLPHRLRHGEVSGALACRCQSERGIVESMAEAASGEQQGDLLTTRQAAEACDVSCQVVRYYTMLGLLHEAKRTVSGRRLYAPSVVQQMHIIRRLQSLGYALRDIRETFLKPRDSTGPRRGG